MTRPADLGSLLSAGEQHTFHGAPAAALAPLEAAVAAARDAGRPAEAMAGTWLLGTAHAALGRYGRALAVLDPLVTADASGPAEQRLFASLACSTVATVHRQLGRAAAARDADRSALALTDGKGEAGFDALLGLAADEVAAGRVEGAGGPLAQAAALVPAGSAEPSAQAGRWWRQQVRLDCVRAETALALGAPADAATRAQGAVWLAERANAPGHVARALLLLGRAQAAISTPGTVPPVAAQAVATLRRAAALADGMAALPIVWPAQQALSELLRADDPEQSRRCHLAARGAVLAIAEELPAELRQAWLARADVAALQIDA